MRPRPYRQVIEVLRALCAAEGIAIETSNAGKGNHRSIIFIDLASGQRLPIVISGKKEISMGVQHESIAHCRKREASFAVDHPARVHSARVGNILDRCFTS